MLHSLSYCIIIIALLSLFINIKALLIANLELSQNAFVALTPGFNSPYLPCILHIESFHGMMSSRKMLLSLHKDMYNCNTVSPLWWNKMF